MQPHFIGEVITKWLRPAGLGNCPDRCMELLRDFHFVDDIGVKWTAPKGSFCDGASIPKIFWNLEDPFIGAYRRASVIHDVYCVTRSVSSWRVHYMFYQGMVTDGCPLWKAYIMWLAVRVFGPRWSTK